MFLYPSEPEGLAWLEASDAAWADRAGDWYEAAGGTFRRGAGDPDPDQDPAP
jgi:hypothetical protein